MTQADSNGPKAYKELTFREYSLSNLPMVLATCFSILMLFASVILAIILQQSSTALSGILTLVSFMSASLLSILITQFSSLRQLRRETAELGQLAAGRVAIQRSKMTQLGRLVGSYRTDDPIVKEKFAFVAYELGSLAYDAKASFSEINAIAKLDPNKVDQIFREADVRVKSDMIEISQSCPS